MAKLIPLKYWVAVVVYLAFSATSFAELIAGLIPSEIPIVSPFLQFVLTSRGLTVIVWVVLALLAAKKCWTWVWSLPVIGNFCAENVFPDLNGGWEISMSSNWPVIDRMRTAAKAENDESFDYSANEEQIPDLGMLTFKATIDQTWFGTKVIVEGANDQILRESRTLAVELIPSNETLGKRIAWTYLQRNKSSRNTTDVQEFHGTALLHLGSDGNTMEGHYWTNRSWKQGLNTAGEVIAKRL